MQLQQQYPGICADTKYQIIRLFTALEYGEQLAHDCACKQVRLVDDKYFSRFLRLQSRQEAFHAKFFRHAAQYLGGLKYRTLPPSLNRFGHKLEKALQHQDLTETLVGQQIVLETFGGAILERLNKGLDNQGVGLRRLRRLLLQKEQRHYAFGEELLWKQMATEVTTIERLRSLSSEYLVLVGNVIDEMSDVFISLDEEPDDYKKHIYKTLPNWLNISKK